MESAHFNAHVLAVPGKRYLKKDGAGGVIESPEEMFWRVARNVAEAERFYSTNSSPEELSEAFFRMMASLDFLPNSSCLMNAGRDLQQLDSGFRRRDEFTVLSHFVIPSCGFNFANGTRPFV
jgi:ribonucleoside-diphosphate reductase alpha chain